MIIKLFFRIIAGILGIFIAIKIVPGVEFSGFVNTILWTGTTLGLINFFIKPLIKIITFPIRLLTFGLFSLVINMVLIWLVVDVFSPIEIKGIIALFWTTLIVWVLNLVFEIYVSKRRKAKEMEK